MQVPEAANTRGFLGSASSRIVREVLASSRQDRDSGPIVDAAHDIETARLGGRPFFHSAKPSDFRDVAMAVPQDTGQLLYLTARAIRARRVVEFGTSFGTSAIYLACAIRDNGGGRLVSTEIEPSKVEVARAGFERCGLADIVEVRSGDAMRTLERELPALDMVFLDGWKNLYLPVLKLLEPRLRDGAVVLADNMHSFKEDVQPYIDHVCAPASGYASAILPVGDGVAYSVRCVASGSATAAVME